jgi:hypothetical protein
MSRVLIESLETCTRVLFHNLKCCLMTCDENAVFFGRPLWKHEYHMLHSLDRWFINPTVYDEPSFHLPGLNDIDTPPPEDFALTKAELLDYYAGIKTKIFGYLAGLSDEDLPQVPAGCKSDRLTLMLSQFRHLYAHLGNINAVTIMNTGQWPYVGGHQSKNVIEDSDRIWE